MMAAGVPLSVAGIAMGLVKEGNQFAVLSATKTIWVIQSRGYRQGRDCVADGRSKALTKKLEQALEQALEARLHILGQMNTVLDAPRESLPRTRQASRSTKTRSATSSVKAVQRFVRLPRSRGRPSILMTICKSVWSERSRAGRRYRDDSGNHRLAEIGEIYTGTVARSWISGPSSRSWERTVHISQIADERVENVTDYLSEGQEVQVKVLDVDQRGRQAVYA